MKILNLNLKAVGPFIDVVLDFSRGNHGLHVILGANEAGKSSSLRALSYLFFGFPHRITDSFVHQPEKLRVGASLQHHDGSVFEFIRRKATKNELRAGDDSTIIEPGVLQRFLGGLDPESFHHRFGIDHGRLRMASEEIRTGKGYFGEMLFSAGAGLAGLRQVQQILLDRSGELFKPRGQNQRINAALSGLRDAQTSQKEYQLSNEEWRKHRESLNQAEEKAHELSTQLAGLRAEQNRLNRLRDAVIPVSRRRRLLEEQKFLGDTPRLRDDFGGEARRAMDASLLADRAIAQAEQAVNDLTAQQERLHPAADVLSAGDEIEALQQRLGAVEKAARDRIERDKLKNDKEHRARQILRELCWPIDLEQAESRRLRADEAKIIRALGQQYAKPRGQLDETNAAIARQTEHIADSKRELASLPEVPEISGLRRALRAARKGGDLDAQLEKLRSELAKSEKKLGLALAQLIGWEGSADELLRLSVPSKETLDHFEERFQKWERQRERLAESREKAHESIRNLESQVKAIEHAGVVPLEADLDGARKLRDQGWRLVRQSWQGESIEEAQARSFVEHFERTRSLADAYEESVRDADSIGDRLRRESANVARKAQWISEIQHHREAIQSLDGDLSEVDQERQRIEADWKTLTSFLKIPTGRSVGEVRAWLRDRDQVVQLAEKVQEVRDQLGPIEAARTSSINALQIALGERAGGSTTLADCIEHAEDLILEADRIIKRRDGLEAAIKAANAELATAQHSRKAAQVELDELRQKWAPLMKRIGLEPDADPLQAEEVLARIQELETVLRDHAGFAVRIKGIDRDEADFQAAVAEMATRVGLNPASDSAYDQARALALLLRDERAVELNRANLSKQIREEQAKLASATEEREAARSILNRLCREAGCSSPDDLAELETRSRSRARIEDELRACEEQLLIAAAGEDLRAFSAEVECLDPDELSATLGQLGDRVGELEHQREEMNRTIGAERAALARMDGQDQRSAQAAETAQAFLAQLQSDVARFAAIRLSSTVLQRAVERYREKSQGPILDRSSALFAELTGGSFRGLQVDEDGNGRLILKGVRPDGRHVGVEGMSEGSHDQLYLALRLASLETWLDDNAPVPFVVDDILMSFDDRRSTAALRALADLSKKTQVLFFTNHRRLAELAVAEIPSDVVFVQELPIRM